MSRFAQNTMEEQKYILENQNSFELKDIFECGQCFRWNEQEDGSYIGVIKNGVIQVKKEKKICKEKNGAKEINKTKEIITFTGKCDGNLQEIVEKYFDLNRDYEKIKSQLENIDEYLKTSIEYGKGIRILNQDLWETIISFIIKNTKGRFQAAFSIKLPEKQPHSQVVAMLYELDSVSTITVI